MFTGIVEGLGRIAEIGSGQQGKSFTIEADLPLDEIRIGDSIAVSGACLTAVEIKAHRFKVEASAETLAKTTLGGKRIGDGVNLERALRLSDRLDGHLVSGHIDGVGRVNRTRHAGRTILISVVVPESLSHYIITKGSIALDGVSLTVNQCDKSHFEVSIIPHTAKETTISRLKNGDRVNIETDMIGKYVERFVTATDQTHNKQTSGPSLIDKTFLAKSGYL
ncbi:MAG: riboflavin synthase [Desulfobacterales bacterium]